MIGIKAAPPAARHRRGAFQETSMHLTPFLTLVLAGYAVFIIALGAVWVGDVIHGQRVSKR